MNAFFLDFHMLTNVWGECYSGTTFTSQTTSIHPTADSYVFSDNPS